MLLGLFAATRAQYKKASFFEKEGRTYGVGTQLYVMGDGKGAVLGLNLSFGRDQDGKQLFSFWELRYIPAYKFKFESLDLDANPVTVTGKSKSQFIYALNYGLYLTRNEGDEQKFKPYITAGMNFVLSGGMKKLDNDVYYDNLVKSVPERNFSAGIGGGLGGIINLSSRFSLKVEGGYTYQYNLSTDFDSEQEEYFMFTSHAYASAGIRYRIVSE